MNINVVKLKEIIENSNNIYLIEEFCEGNDLS